MNSSVILEKNPLSAELVRRWFTNKMFDSIQNDTTVPQEFKDYVMSEGVSNESLSIFIDSNPRSLFDLFDEHDVIIETIVYPDKTFSCKIGQQATTLSWNTRRESEEFAIESAFEILEEKLKE